MKKSFITILIFLTTFMTNALRAQLWKQYADSAKAFNDQKDTDKAIELYSKAREELKKDSAGTSSYASICDTVALLFVKKSEFEKAEPLFLEAKQIREAIKGKNNLDYARSCHYLGFLYYNKAQYQIAETFYLQARQIRENILGKNNEDYTKTCNNLANLYYYTNRYEKAEPLYLEVKQIREKLLGKEHPDYATSCNNLAILYSKMGQYEKAEPLILETKQIRERLLGKVHPDYARFCIDFAVLYESMGQYEKAEPLHTEAKKILENVLGKNHPDYALSCNNLAVLYEKMRQYEKAELLFLEARQIREKVSGKEHPDYALSCYNLAVLYRDMVQYEKAVPLYLEAMQIREKVLGKEHPEYAISCNDLAILYWRMGHYEKAAPLYMEAKKIREKVLGKEHPEYGISCNDLAALYYDMGQYEKAEPLYLEAKKIREKVLGKEHPEYAASCNNLATLYRQIGQYEEAERLYLEAKKIRARVLGKEHSEYATSCDDLAGLYLLIGQYEKAELLYVEAKRIQGKVLGKEHPVYAAACNNLANLYRHMGQYEKAELLYLEAMQIKEKASGREHPEYAAYCNNLADLYSYVGQYEKAEQLYQEAKQIQEKVVGEEHPDYASSCDNLGILYEKMGQYEKAKQLYIEAKQIRQKVLGRQHPDYRLSCDNLANLYRLMHQPLQAEKEFKESFSVNAYNLFSVFQFTNEKEKTAFIKNISGEDDKAYSFYVSEKIKSEQPYSLSLFHRNLILSSSQALMNLVFSADDTSLINKYNEWINSKKYLAVLYSKPVDERPEEVAKIEEKAGQLEKELARLSSGFKKQQQRVDWKDIKNKLKTDEASIEFASFHFTDGKRDTDTVLYAALVLRKNMLLPVMIQLFDEKQLGNLLSSTRNKTTKDGVRQLYSSRGVGGDTSINLNKSIYELIWKPLEKELKGIKTIYFAPSGMLHRIAFAALPVNQKEVLSDRYRLVQLATTASVTDQTSTFITSSDDLQLYGGINYDADSTELKQTIQLHAISAKNEKTRSLPDDLTPSGSLSYLPGTAAEIEKIEKQAKQTHNHLSVLSGVKATEESFKGLNDKASPSVIHIATHGFFFPDPKQEIKKEIQREFESGKVFKQSDNPLFRSGLVFAGANHAWQGHPIDGVEDGILTAYEVSNMYLPNTKLVVLSACETALGDIQGSEGVYGLQRSFKTAGVQNLVMSLWKVPDQETSEFMQEFYKNMFAKQTVRDAFYHAQSTMKNKYRSDPYKWAAWVFVR